MSEPEEHGFNFDGIITAEGVLEIQIELDVNSVDQIGPFAQDDDEEITILVEVHCFKASAAMAE